MWNFDEVPTSILGTLDPMEIFSFENDYPPKKGMLTGIYKWNPGSGFPMHATQTVDVIYILAGQMELVLEKGSTVLSPGDCVIQRTTPHAWKVVSETPCIFVAFGVAIK